MREINKKRGVFSDKIDVKKEKDYVEHVVDELKDEINERSVLGMCAPQLGYFARIICLKIGDKVQEFINPVLRRADKITFVKETSLSLEDETKEYLVPRHTNIDIYYQDKKGRMHGGTLNDIAATTFMQLYDILMGVFIDDLYEEVPANFDTFSDEDLNEYLREYYNRLEGKSDEIDNEIKEDPSLEDIKERLETYKALSLAELKSRQEEKNNLNREQRRKLQRELNKRTGGDKKWMRLY